MLSRLDLSGKEKERAVVYKMLYVYYSVVRVLCFHVLGLRKQEDLLSLKLIAFYWAKC